MEVTGRDWPWKVTCIKCGATAVESTTVVHKETCPEYKVTASTMTPKTVADFTRVCDQTGLSEKLRKD